MSRRNRRRRRGVLSTCSRLANFTHDLLPHLRTAHSLSLLVNLTSLIGILTVLTLHQSVTAAQLGVPWAGAVAALALDCLQLVADLPSLLFDQSATRLFLQVSDLPISPHISPHLHTFSRLPHPFDPSATRLFLQVIFPHLPPSPRLLTPSHTFSRRGCSSS